MRVVAFLPEYCSTQAGIVNAIAQGIPGCKIGTLGKYQPCDIAVVLGSVKKAYKPTHAKAEILDRHKGHRLIMIESAFVNRANYYQVGWGGYAGNGDFVSDGVPSDRWDSFGIEVFPWRKTGDYVLVCGQLLRDTQVQDVDHAKWCRDTVNQLQANGYKVVFRPHPKEEKKSYGIPAKLFDSGTLDNALDNALATVVWNSTSAIDSIIRGVPVVVGHKSCMAWPMASTSIDSLRYPSRRQFLAGIGYSQWTLEEMRRGDTWRHLTRGNNERP